MGNNNLYKVENTLRSMAKRYKSVKYSLGLAILFLIMGISAFSEEVVAQQEAVAQQEVMTTEQIATSKENLRNSVGSLQSKIDAARAENEKGLAGLRLELIQLMEQGDQVVKSPWSSWQFGANYMYSKWNGTYKGRGDKAQKYPFEGVFTRSNDLFLRSVSPDSELYEQYIATVVDNAVHSATTSTIKQRGGSTNYGLASVIKNQEPIASIELGASVRPWNNQTFLVGGSRVATLDNARGGGRIKNAATINMVGPLVVGYKIQNDNAGTGKREVLNVGTLTDDAEKGYRTPDGLGGLYVGYGTANPSNSKDISLVPNLGGGSPYPGKK